MGVRERQRRLLNYKTDGIIFLLPRTLLNELQNVYDEYQREALTSLVSAWERDEFNEREVRL